VDSADKRPRPTPAAKSKALTDLERATYEWQMWVPDFGERGQEALKAATVLVSRIGGVGGTAAYYLAAAGVGKLILCHAGNLKQSDLHRQILMREDRVGQSRIDTAVKRLKELNPRVEIQAVAENISEANAAELVGRADLVVSCAPLFEERFAKNRAAVQHNKPLVDCAMYELDAQIMTIVPGVTPCLACLYPTKPETWKRQFPVFGAVSGMIGAMGAMEAIKILTGMATPLKNELLTCSLRDMSFRKIKIRRNPDCPVCASRR
jgi:molybdopterin-synthase adenylyltransferase